MVSTSVAAKQLDLSEQQIRKLCRNGTLQAEQVGRTWVIRPDAIIQYQNERTFKVAEDHPRYNATNSQKPIALSFFSGAMGLDIGLEKAGIEVILACEVDKACRETINLNKPDIALLGDICDYSAKDIMKKASLKAGDDVDLIIGGPPCQAFSTAGKRQGFNDDRGNVFLTYLDIALEIKPKFLVIENVRGLLSAPLNHRPHSQRGEGYPSLNTDEQKGGALFYIINRLKKAGYSVSFNLYNSANFGSPQIRERVVIMCSRDGNKLPYLEPTHSKNGDYGLPKWKKLKETLKGLQKVKHTHVNFSAKRLKYYSLLKAGQNWRDLPPELQKEAMGQSYYAGGGKTGFYRRLDWNAPSPTLVTHPAMPATDLAHPTEDRPLSIQEYKKIQEFPSNWKIAGKLLDQYKQVGNAVPISLGYAIGRFIVKYMNNKQIKNYMNFPYSRYKNTDDISWLVNFQKSIDKNREKESQLTLI